MCVAPTYAHIYNGTFHPSRVAPARLSVPLLPPSPLPCVSVPPQAGEGELAERSELQEALIRSEEQRLQLARALIDFQV